LSCTECGRCQDVCPAYATGKALSPKLLIMGMRDQLLSGATTPIVPNAVTDDVVWDCVTCGACMRECPVGIEHVDHIIDLRRNLVMVESRFPEEAGADAARRGSILESLGQTPGRPAPNGPTASREGVEAGEPAPDVLFWVGCAPAFDERARKAAVSTAKLMQMAGVDFAILGPREACTGDPARRMGDEFTYQRLAGQNVATLNETGMKRIVTTCPHCFNTIGSEYPDFGGRYEVVHSHGVPGRARSRGQARADAQRADDHVSRPRATSRDTTTCAHSRASWWMPWQSDRDAPKSRAATFCCGAGGARIGWRKSAAGRSTRSRVREAAATGAESARVWRAPSAR